MEYDHTERTEDDSAATAANSPCVALVPVTQTAQWTPRPIRPLPRPNSNFVTHLIATFEQVPQTCSLRRASLSDANAAYSSSGKHVASAGLKARQIV
jgi:hypothetical protein